jgi:TRAP-type C4-dicarboxylate transport system substrate-binding protein
MDVNEALALEAAQRLAEQQAAQDDEVDDEVLDEGVEFVDPSLGHLMHLMSLVDLLSTPAPEPRPVHRP